MRNIERIRQVIAEFRQMHRRIAGLEESFARFDADMRGTLGAHSAMLRALAAQESDNRRRLWELRGTDEYRLAFEDENPLVSILVVTRERPRLLIERSLNSILSQSYENLEVIVVGDDAPPETFRAVEQLGDRRVRVTGVSTRVVREPPELHWLTAKTLPMGEAYSMAKGLWMMEFDDDDRLRPDAIERLLNVARTERAEAVHARFRMHKPDGTATVMGAAPPQLGNFWLGLSLAGLRFIAREFHAADLTIPGDWYRADRMIRAGVRFAFEATEVFDYYPSRLWNHDV